MPRQRSHRIEPRCAARRQHAEGDPGDERDRHRRRHHPVGLLRRPRRHEMGKAARVHGIRLSVECATVIAIACIVFARWQDSRLDAVKANVRSIQSVEAIEVPYYIERLKDLPTRSGSVKRLNPANDPLWPCFTAPQ